MMQSEAWNDFIFRNGPRSGRFLQSWQWGDFQEQVGATIQRLHKNDSVGLWIERSVPGVGSYAYCPKGPIGRWSVPEGSFFFLRTEPVEPDQLPNKARPTIGIQPSHTSMIDLTQDEDVMLAKMHHKTRYNIRLASKHGVHVSLAKHSLDDVWKLFEQTGTRGNFRLHAKSYYKNMLSTLRGQCEAFLAVAVYEGHPIAVTVMIDFGDTRTYLHGASTREHRQVMAPYLLHWELIKSAKAAGMHWYDWWGVAPLDACNHPWEGLSRFKRGFGGEDVVSPGTFDVIKKPALYKLYEVARTIRRIV